MAQRSKINCQNCPEKSVCPMDFAKTSHIAEGDIKALTIHIINTAPVGEPENELQHNHIAVARAVEFDTLMAAMSGNHAAIEILEATKAAPMVKERSSESLPANVPGNALLN